MCWSRPSPRQTKRYLWRSAWRRCSRPGSSRATPASGASCHFLDPDLWAALCPVLASLPSCLTDLPSILLPFPSFSGVRSALEWLRVSALTPSSRPHSFLPWYYSWAGLPGNQSASFCRNSTQRHALHSDLIDSIASLPKAFLLPVRKPLQPLSSSSYIFNAGGSGRHRYYKSVSFLSSSSWKLTESLVHAQLGMGGF